MARRTGPEEEPGSSRAAGRTPGQLAYIALLGTTSAGTVGGTIINAPLEWIKQEFGASDSRVVLAVAAYTVAMAVFVPLAGWLCDRLGPIRVVAAGLAVLAAAQLAAVASVNLEMLIALRAVQGMACATFPPSVQRALPALWPHKGATALAAWASAIGVGQAVGPPIGGVIAQFLGWRGVFGFAGLVSAVLLVAVLLLVPSIPGRKVPFHAPGVLILMLSIGLFVIAATMVGQRLPWGQDALVAGAALVSGVAFVVIAARRSDRLVAPRALLERRYARATAMAASTMFIMGIVLTSLPLWLAQSLGLGPGPVGVIVFAMAAAMATSARITSAARRAWGGWATSIAALGALVAVPMLLGLWLDRGPGESAVVLQSILIVLALLTMGVAINAGQSLAAFSVSLSDTGRNSLAFGMHNTARFVSMALGFAWTALMYPFGSMALTFTGALLAAGATLLLVLRGGPLDAQGGQPDGSDGAMDGPR